MRGRAQRGPVGVEMPRAALLRGSSGYLRQSRAKTKMHCVKRLVQRLIARDFGRQVAKFQLHVAVRNGYTCPASRPEGREIS